MHTRVNDVHAWPVRPRVRNACLADANEHPMHVSTAATSVFFAKIATETRQCTLSAHSAAMFSSDGINLMEIGYGMAANAGGGESWASEPKQT